MASLMTAQISLFWNADVIDMPRSFLPVVRFLVDSFATWMMPDSLVMMRASSKALRSSFSSRRSALVFVRISLCSFLCLA